MRKIGLLLSAVALGFGAQAQIAVTSSSLNYTQNFNTLDTANANSSNLPTGWSIFEYGSSTTTVNNQYKGGNGSATTGDTYSFGSTGSMERALGSLASGSLISHYGAKFVNNTGTTITGFTISYKGEQWRFGQAGRANVDSLRFMYSTTATGVSDTVSANYTESQALMFNSPNITPAAAGPLDGNLAANSATKSATITVSVPAGGTLVIKWIDPNIVGTDDALAVDDVNITFTTSGTGTPSYRPVITGMTPANNATGVALTAPLTVTFDRTVTGNAAGSFRIKNRTDNTVQTIAGNNVTVSGHTVTIPGVTLQNSKTYHVTFDSTAIDTAGYKSYGMYDSTAWVFTTVAAPVGPVSSINENFNTSCPAGVPAGWLQYSFSGTQTWRCSNTAPDYYMTMNGGSSSASDTNQDWLITPELISAANTKLSFRTRFRFAGPNMEVVYSTNYSGTGNPNVAGWTSLGINTYSAADSNQWATKTANLPTGNIRIAFKYTSLQSATPGFARQWDVDSVVAMAGTGIGSISSTANTLPVRVIGAANNGHVVIGFDLEQSAALNIAIYDLTGRVVYTESARGVSGKNTLTLAPQTLQSGLYIIRLSDGRQQGVARTYIQ